MDNNSKCKYYIMILFFILLDLYINIKKYVESKKKKNK